MLVHLDLSSEKNNKNLSTNELTSNSSKNDDKFSEKMDYEESLKKPIYHPINDAMWRSGEKTPYLAFAKTLAGIAYFC